jgi:hypothetical protein
MRSRQRLKATDSPHRRQRLDENELTAVFDYWTARLGPPPRPRRPLTVAHVVEEPDACQVDREVVRRGGDLCAQRGVEHRRVGDRGFPAAVTTRTPDPGSLVVTVSRPSASGRCASVIAAAAFRAWPVRPEPDRNLSNGASLETPFVGRRACWMGL